MKILDVVKTKLVTIKQTITRGATLDREFVISSLQAMPHYFFFLTLMVLGVFLIAILQPHISLPFIRVMLAFLFQMLVIASLGYPLLMLLKGWLREIGVAKQKPAHILICAGVSSFVALIVFVLYFRMEQDIKMYEPAIQWAAVIDGREVMARSIPEYLMGLGESFNLDYSGLPAFGLIFLSWLFGASFTGYSLSIFLLYFFPACILITIYSLRLLAGIRTNNMGILPLVVGVLICFFSATFLCPVLRGYPDVAGVACISLLLNLSLRWNGLDFSLGRNFLIALLCLVTILMRPWYSLYLICFVFGYVIYALKPDKTLVVRLLMYLRNLLFITIFFVGLALIFNSQFFAVLGRLINPTYQPTGSEILVNFQQILADNGIIMLVLGLSGFVYLVIREGTRPQALHLSFAFFGAMAWYLSCQTMYTQQYYLFLPSVLIGLCVLADLGIQHLTDFKGLALSLGLSAVCLFNFAAVYVPFVGVQSEIMEPLFSSLYGRPLNYSNVPILKEITKELDSTIAGTGEKAYVIGRSDELSSELLRNSGLPENTNAAPFVLTSNTMDIRDGFPSQLFMADYVLMTNPFVDSYSGRQQIDFQAYEMFLNDPIAKDYYEVKNSYDEGGGVIMVFKKTRPTDAVIVKHLSDRLKAVYPDNALVYEPDYFLALLGVDKTTEYEYDHYANKRIIIEKQAQKPVGLRWQTSGTFKVLEFNMSCPVEGLEMVVSDQEKEIVRTPLKVGEDVSYKFDISASETVDISIQAAQGNNDPDAQLTLNHNNSAIH